MEVPVEEAALNASKPLDSKWLQAAGLHPGQSLRKRCFELPPRGHGLNRNFPGCPKQNDRLVTDWQEVLRDFLHSNSELESLVSVFVHKIVLMGVQNWNWATSTLMDLTWAVLLLAWDAFQTGSLPTPNAEGDCRETVGNIKSLRQQYRDLQAQFHKCRAEWLDEISLLRDLKRAERWDALKQEAFDQAMEHDVYQFLPEDSFENDQQPYFRAALEEALKVAILALKGECPTCKLLQAQLDVASEKMAAFTADVGEKDLSKTQIDRGRERSDEALQENQKNIQAFEKLNVELAAQVELWKSKAILIEIREADILDDTRFDKIVALWEEGKSAIAELRRLRNAGHVDGDGDVRDTGKAAEGGDKKPASLAAQDNQKGKQSEREASLLREGDDLRRRIRELEEALASQAKQLEASLKRGQLACLNTGQLSEATVTKQGNDEKEGKMEELDTEVFKLMKQLQDEKALRQAAEDREATLKEELLKLQANIATLEASQSSGRTSDQDGGKARKHNASTDDTLDFAKLGKGASDDALREENEQLAAQLRKTRRQIGEQEKLIEQLRRQLHELKKLLVAAGVDVDLIDNLVEEMGQEDSSKPKVKVFDRLYDDAMRRRDTSPASILLKLLTNALTDPVAHPKDDQFEAQSTDQYPAADLDATRLQAFDPYGGGGITAQRLEQKLLALQDETAKKWDSKLSREHRRSTMPQNGILWSTAPAGLSKCSKEDASATTVAGQSRPSLGSDVCGETSASSEQQRTPLLSRTSGTFVASAGIPMPNGPISGAVGSHGSVGGGAATLLAGSASLATCFVDNGASTPAGFGGLSVARGSIAVSGSPPKLGTLAETMALAGMASGKARVPHASTWERRRTTMSAKQKDKGVQHAPESADWLVAESTVADGLEDQQLCPQCLRPLPRSAVSFDQPQQLQREEQQLQRGVSESSGGGLSNVSSQQQQRRGSNGSSTSLRVSSAGGKPRRRTVTFGQPARPGTAPSRSSTCSVRTTSTVTTSASVGPSDSGKFGSKNNLQGTGIAARLERFSMTHGDVSFETYCRSLNDQRLAQDTLPAGSRSSATDIASLGHHDSEFAAAMARQAEVAAADAAPSPSRTDRKSFMLSHLLLGRHLQKQLVADADDTDGQAVNETAVALVRPSSGGRGSPAGPNAAQTVGVHPAQRPPSAEGGGRTGTSAARLLLESRSLPHLR